MHFLVHSFFKPIDKDIEALFAIWQDAHREFVGRYQDQIVARGPTLDENGLRISNVMIAEFADRAAVDEFLAGEPLTKAGVFSRIVVEPFSLNWPKSKSA